MQLRPQPLQAPPHTHTRETDFCKAPHGVAFQRMASLACTWWCLQWLGPSMHFQLSRSFHAWHSVNLSEMYLQMWSIIPFCLYCDWWSQHYKHACLVLLAWWSAVPKLTVRVASRQLWTWCRWLWRQKPILVLVWYHISCLLFDLTQHGSVLCCDCLSGHQLVSWPYTMDCKDSSHLHIMTNVPEESLLHFQKLVYFSFCAPYICLCFPCISITSSVRAVTLLLQIVLCYDVMWAWARNFFIRFLNLWVGRAAGKMGLKPLHLLELLKTPPPLQTLSVVCWGMKRPLSSVYSCVSVTCKPTWSKPALCVCKEAERTVLHILQDCFLWWGQGHKPWPQDETTVIWLWGMVKDLCRTIYFLATGGSLS